MKKSLYLLVIGLVSCGLNAPVYGKEVVEEFSGTRSGHTGVFEVKAPWLLDWRLNGEFPQSLAIDVSLIEADTGVHVGVVLKSRYVSNGVRLFDQGGRFQFKIDATMARWMLRVEQLTDEEAALYTPVR